MNPGRILQLLKYYEEDPSDPFNIYGLATEYRNADPQQAWKYYTILLKEHPSYLPTYYHAAVMLMDRDDIDEAERLIDAGIVLAKEQNNQLALRELNNLLNELLDY